MLTILSWLKRRNAGELLILSFLSLICIGAFLLKLPFSENRKLGWIDAFFIATSAVCVTGLSVVDIGSHFNLFGQAVILSLIQLGGFGIMSFSSFLLFIIGRKVPIVVQDAGGEIFSLIRSFPLRALLKKALLYVGVIEGAGFLALWISFRKDFSFFSSIWNALFHSISAFCNAGFSPLPNNLENFVDRFFVNIIIMTLIIMGGLGFYVLIELMEFVRRKKRLIRLSLHTKLVLLFSLILIFSGASLLLFFEWNNSFEGLKLKTRILASFFHSITARTCGFNTLRIGDLSEISLFTLIVLMFIGGAPGSTAGGVKVTTFSVLIIVGLSWLSRRTEGEIFGRAISQETVLRAVQVFILSVLVLCVFVFLLLITEGALIPHHQGSGKFIEVVFEATSAFGTVGLSTGLTPRLSNTGRVLISLLMFIGRLGPLTFIFAVTEKRVTLPYKLPKEDVMIG